MIWSFILHKYWGNIRKVSYNTHITYVSLLAIGIFMKLWKYILHIRYRSEVTSHSLTTLLLNSRYSMLFSLQVFAQILRELRLTSRTRLAELDHSRLCWFCHSSDELPRCLRIIIHFRVPTCKRGMTPPKCLHVISNAGTVMCFIDYGFL